VVPTRVRPHRVEDVGERVDLLGLGLGDLLLVAADKTAPRTE
jgi:hypothetical protein